MDGGHREQIDPIEGAPMTRIIIVADVSAGWP